MVDKKIILLFCFGILILNFVSAFPKIEPYVNDFANLLTPEQEQNLNLLIDKVEQNSSYEIAIVTVLNTEGQDRIEYANKIGDENGVGKKGLSNGVVILWSLDNEQGGAIATGRGSESVLNDAKVGRIGREARETYFNNEKYYEGFEFIVQEISKEIKGSISINSRESLSDNKIFLSILLTIAGIIFLGLIIALRYSESSNSGSWETFISSGSSSSGTSFGGGSFGGGGARF